MKNRFKVGQGVFDCLSCGRKTTGPHGVIGPEVCGECYELSGLDNMINDAGRKALPGEIDEAKALLDDIARKGGDADAAKTDCRYIWPHNESD